MPSERVPTSPPYYDFNGGLGRRRSTLGLASEAGKDNSSKQHPLSPPLSPTRTRNRNTNAPSNSNVRFAQRLRCNSGLSLHVNEDALRQYTDYNADGTSRGPLFKPFNWQQESETPGRRNSGHRNLVSGDEQGWTLPIPDVLGLEIFQTVLKDPAAAAGLLKFSRGAGYGVNMAYLAKTQEYSTVIDHLESVLYTISSNYTSVTSATPIPLPNQAFRSLQNDLRYVTGSILPGLENLFLESRSYVEQRVVKDLYPAFVKHQLARATTTSLASHPRLPEADYPGLGSAYCITDFQNEDRIKYSSDEFAHLLRRTRDDIINQNIATLQGWTNAAASFRMRQAMSKREEFTDLVVSYRGDGQPFWNLVYMCPLPHATESGRYCLHSYVNVSDKTKTSSDILKLLGNDYSSSDVSSGRPSTGSAGSVGSRRSNSSRDRSNEDRSSSQGRDRDSSRNRSSRRLFNSFRRTPEPPPLSHHNESDSALAEPFGFPEPPIPRLSEDFPPSPILRPEAATAYGRLFLLKHQTGVKSRLLISHVSPGACELLGPTLTADVILDKDVFKVMSQQARSPSITKSFKSLIRHGVLNSGERVTAEMLLPLQRGRKGSVASMGWGSDGGSSQRGRRGTAQVNCYWTPLRGEKAVEWVVLVMIPAG